ncbi:MAG TPA: hypothetical protein VE667_08030, partial [Xanthobacteraceae bacterium]|nr:hypothetical protein [Xanthobacteraceae bacterium]
MQTSKDRILTTHAGSLPRPKPLVDFVLEREQGRAVDSARFEAETAKAVDEVVARQVGEVAPAVGKIRMRQEIASDHDVAAFLGRARVRRDAG